MMIWGPTWIIWLFGAVIVSYTVYKCVKDYLKAEESQKPKIFKTYMVVLAVSVVLFAGMKVTGISEKLFPEYYPTQFTDQEKLDILEEVIGD